MTYLNVKSTEVLLNANSRVYPATHFMFIIFSVPSALQFSVLLLREKYTVNAISDISKFRSLTVNSTAAVFSISNAVILCVFLFIFETDSEFIKETSDKKYSFKCISHAAWIYSMLASYQTLLIRCQCQGEVADA